MQLLLCFLWSTLCSIAIIVTYLHLAFHIKLQKTPATLIALLRLCPIHEDRENGIISSTNALPKGTIHPKIKIQFITHPHAEGKLGEVSLSKTISGDPQPNSFAAFC